MILEVIKIIVLGIVQGITEWLPISSTAHLLLIEKIFPLLQNEEFIKLFFVLVQFGSIIAVLLLFFNKLNPLSFKKTPEEKQRSWELWFKVIVATIPAVVVGFLMSKLIEDSFFKPVVSAVTLIFYGIVFIIVEKKITPNQKKSTSLEAITYKQALMIGCFQALALIPGTSRSGATIIGGLLLGIKRTAIAEFSFFMAIPVMFGASLLKIIRYNIELTTNELLLLILGMLVSFVVSLAVIRILLQYIKKHDFQIFGWYRIALGLIILVMIFCTIY